MCWHESRTEIGEKTQRQGLGVDQALRLRGQRQVQANYIGITRHLLYIGFVHVTLGKTEPVFIMRQHGHIKRRQQPAKCAGRAQRGTERVADQLGQAWRESNVGDPDFEASSTICWSFPVRGAPNCGVCRWISTAS